MTALQCILALSALISPLSVALVPPRRSLRGAGCSRRMAETEASDSLSISVELVSSVTDVDPEQWNACSDRETPKNCGEEEADAPVSSPAAPPARRKAGSRCTWWPRVRTTRCWAWCLCIGRATAWASTSLTRLVTILLLRVVAFAPEEKGDAMWLTDGI
eukprot:scaffold2325_cov257-Pinguiococcus_pyrenoidosus.AAC.2